MRLVESLFDLDDILKNPFCNDYESDAVTVEKDVVYDKSLPDLLKADIYYRSDAKRRAVLINVHGGGWITGDKKWRKGFATILADRGIFVVNVNYGLAPQYKFPDMAAQLFSALNFVYENAEKYDLDTGRIYMGGDSAGAHLSAVAGAVQSDPERRRKFGIAPSPARLKGVVLLCGVYDLEKTFKLHATHGVLKDLTGAGKRGLKDYEFKSEISPLNIIESDFPKTLLVSAKLDVFAAGQDEEIARKFDEKGVKYFRFVSSDVFSADHCFFLRYRQQNSALVYDLIEKFIADDDFVE